VTLCHTSLAYLQNLVNTYKNHPAAAKFNGKTILSTFAGQDCAFGQGSVVNGWNAVMGGDRNAFYWMPTFTGAPEGLNALQIDAEVAWNSGWPTGGGDIDTSPDKYYMSLLGPNRYVATVSPGFFTHFAYKNFIWRGDNWLYAERWEQLIAMRQQIDQVEIISWNDVSGGRLSVVTKF
jgi:glucan endo-1,3-alpha-glucosidase